MRIVPSLILAATLATLPPAAQAQQLPEGFDASALIALSDGAMLASGYIDGLLGPRAADLLSVMPQDAAQPAQVGVSNSVAMWPNVLDLTPDNRFAIISEPFAQPPETAQYFSDIERGKRLTVVDLSDPSAPRVVQTIEALSATAAVDVRPSGDLVAVTLPFEGKIALYPFENGRLGEPKLIELGVAELAGSFVPEFKWRPDGDFAAVTLGGANRVVFYKYDGETLTPWGDPMQTAPLPGMGLWTPNGEYFIVTTITATADMAQLAYDANTSLFAVFAFDDTTEPDSPPRRADDRKHEVQVASVQHARVGHIPSGMGYVETFALSPDGTLIAAANMRASWLPKGHPGRTEDSEISLFSVDQESGALKRVLTQELPGVILPQGLSFDTDGSHLAVTSFQGANGEPASLHVFALNKAASGNPELTQASAPIELPRGAHFLKVVR